MVLGASGYCAQGARAEGGFNELNKEVHHHRVSSRALNLKPFFGSERIRVPFSCSESNPNLRL